MDIEELSKACEALLMSPSDKEVENVVEQIGNLSNTFGSCSSTFLEKLNQVQEAGLFASMGKLFTDCILTPKQQQIVIKFWDFLIQTSNSSEEYDIFFKNNLLNCMVLYPFDLKSDDIRRSYSTVLKGISMKLNNFSFDHLIYNDEIPILTHSLPFINYKDSITISAMRLVLLNLCMCKDPRIEDELYIPSTRVPIAKLVTDADSDALAFLSDLLDVAPYSVQSFLIDCVKENAMKSDWHSLARMISFLGETKAKSALTEVISARITEISVKESIMLGIILHSLDHHLITADAAIRAGLMRVSVPSFDGSVQVLPSKISLLDDIAREVMERRSITSVALILRIFSKIYKSPPLVVTDLLQAIAADAKNCTIEHFIKLPMRRPRTDLDYLLEAPEPIPNEQRIITILAEVARFLSKGSDDPFVCFVFPELQESFHQTYSISAEKPPIELTSQKIIAGDQSFAISQLYIKGASAGMHSSASSQAGLLKESALRAKKSRQVTLCHIQQKTTRNSMVFSAPEENISISFESPAIASQFETDLLDLQKKLITKMIDQLMSNLMSKPTKNIL